MLTVHIPSIDLWDERINEFKYIEGQDLVIEHSLVSISAWESKWKIPFLSNEQKTREQSIDYIKIMTQNNVNNEIYDYISDETIEQINNYIDDPMTATWFSDKGAGGNNGQVTTSELIYYWMIALNIPYDCRNWHLNRLLTLIKVCNEKNKDPKKMSEKEVLQTQADINRKRRAEIAANKNRT